MKKLIGIFIFLMSAVVFPQQKIPQLISDEGGISLLTQSVEANVVGKVADVRIYQTFKVSDAKALEYIFPIDLETSLYDLTVYYPDKIFSLESKSMMNVRKQVNVQNQKKKNITIAQGTESEFIRILLMDYPPDEEIKVEVKYMQDLERDGEHKSLMIPALISKNYKNKLEEFSFQINLIGPTAIYDSEVKTYKTTSKNISKRHQVLSYKGKEWKRPIDLHYNTRGETPEAGMLVFEDKGCRYILGVVEPPKVIKPKELAPREYIFVMDVSGSMHGFPLETSKELITKILGNLSSEEKFNILFFDGSSDFLADESVYATPENIKMAIETINSQRGKGDTRLRDALQKVYKMKLGNEYNRIVVLITDGLFGETNVLYSGIRNNLKDAQYFVFGIGYEIGRITLQRMGAAAGTRPVLINERMDADREMQKFFKLINRPLLRHIEIQSKELNLNETYPNQFNGFLSDHSSSFVSKDCSNARDPKLVLTGLNGSKRYNQTFRLPTLKENDDLFILKYLWAREKIDFLLSEEEICGAQCVKSGKYRTQIIKLGEELNIATPYTSFIEEVYVNKNGEKGDKYSLYSDPNTQLTFQNDFDSDFDGIPNMFDECPFDKGPKELNGCPRSKEVKMTEEVNRMIKGIEFDFDSYAIKEQFHSRLDMASEIIMSQPNQKFIVEGHTDAAGTPEYNMELSLNRSRAVVNFLKEKGVKESQLKVTGKGDKELLHPECRPQEKCSDKKNFENRRVIFKLTE